MNQDTLFGKKVISTINYNEQEIIRDILHLHSHNGVIDVDPCYSVGNFYKRGITKPIHKFDLSPQTEDTIEASSNNIPLGDGSVNTIIFDPPFLIGGGEYKETQDGSCIIAKRFEAFKTWSELKEMYSTSLVEFYRILKPNGIVIFKCQDVVNSGKNHMTHSWVMNTALDIGYYPKDLFILLAKNRLTDGRKQQHARKFHCYYWVLQKETSKVNYSL